MFGISRFHKSSEDIMLPNRIDFIRDCDFYTSNLGSNIMDTILKSGQGDVKKIADILIT